MTVRMSKTLLSGLGLAVLLAPGCVQPRDPAADRAAIARVREQALAALNAGDAEALLVVLAEDIVLMRTGDVTLVGRGQVGEHLRDLFSRVELDVTRQEQRLTLADEWAFDHSLLTGTWIPKAGGDPRPINARVTDILKLEWDDSWKYTRLMGLPSLESHGGEEEEPAEGAAGE